MPPVKFTEIITFSSEDPSAPAENLLRAETYRKWKCGSNDKQASVTLKFERMVTIRSIDIANEGSAFVEVLVGREGGGAFEVLLVASSFMTPIESRNSENLNRVRMFGPEKLNKNIAEQKWDRLKVVCTQPFNKNMQHGLSFITVSSADENSSSSSTTEIKLGKFTLKEEDNSDPISVGSWFGRRKENPSSTASGAAAIRAASAAITSSPTPSSLKRKAETSNTPDVGFYQLKKKNIERPASPVALPSNNSHEQKQRQHESNVHDKKENHEQKQRKQESNEHVKKEKRKHNEEDEQSARENKKQDRSDDRNKEDRYVDKGNKEDNKRKLENEDDSKKEKGSYKDESRHKTINKDKTERSKKNIKSLPFRNLMKNVVFVMSGYQNPRRSQLRDKLMEMGAKYKPDWDDTCTHLICAFSNTPKYVQVKDKGKIVTHKWIEDSYSNKIRYPWRRYQLVQELDPELESEEEILSEELVPKPSTSSHAEPNSEDLYGGDTDTDMSDNENTDDEIERALENQKKQSVKTSPKANIKIKQEFETSSKENIKIKQEFETSPKEKVKIKQEIENGSHRNVNYDTFSKGRSENYEKVSNFNSHKIKEEIKIKKEPTNISNDDEYDAETDVDEENENCLKRVDTSSISLPSLGDYLSGRNFLIYGKISNKKKRILQRYITAFNGTLHEYMSGEVQFVITEDEWDNNFDNALNDNPSLQFVKPTWIWRCSDRQKFVPHQPFMVVPRE